MVTILLSVPCVIVHVGNNISQTLTCLIFSFGVGLLSFSSASLLMLVKLKSKIASFFIKIFSVCLLSLPGLIYLSYCIPYMTAKKALTELDILAFLGSYSQEAFSYFVSNINWTTFLWVIPVFILFVVAAINYALKYKKIGFNTLITTLLFGIIFVGSFMHNLVTEPFEKAMVKLREFQTFSEKVKKQKNTPNVISENYEKRIYVVVIGESQNRTHMSVYGYHRPTTPFLDSVKNNHTDGTWIFFDNGYSCHTHTVETLSWALTDINSFNKKTLSNSTDIMSVLNSHGYQTWLFSNQKKTEQYNVAHIVQQAQKQFWLNEEILIDTYDEVILNNLPTEEELSDKPNVIFIHLLGNHDAYRDRYPNKWDKFGNTQVDYYDSSILYNDYIIQKIYEHFSKMKNFSALIYMADHADDVNNNLFSHNYSIFTWDMTKIPFFAFFSSDYVEKYNKKIKNLQTRKSTPFVNDLFFDTLLGITEIRDENYVAKNDLGSEYYEYSRDDLSVLHGTKKLTDEPVDDLLKYRSKIWLHRVNSPKKIQDVGEKYFGVELDIIYYEKEDAFENSHDKTDLLKYPLEQTLKNHAYWHHFWFDFKNLTQENNSQAKQTLEKLMKNNYISKDKVWVESQNLEALESFTKDGWKTSYYMPYYKFEEMTQKEIENIKSQIEAISYSGKVQAISFSGIYYPFIMSLNLNPKISLLTWYDLQTFEELKEKDYFLETLKNPQIEVVLVKEYGENHR